jgi:hypothetical protein
MTEVEVLASLTQFGMAGLIAWMWLVERRASTERERQILSAHERLMEQRVQLDSLLKVVGDNTRAVTALESAQRALARAVDSALGARRREPDPKAPGRLGTYSDAV